MFQLQAKNKIHSVSKFELEAMSPMHMIHVDCNTVQL